MRIGELAEHAGVTTKTIRFYEGRGLVPPPERAANGYREYEPDVVARLAFIRAAQASGLTLREIAQVLAVRDGGDAPCQHVRGLLVDKLAELDHKIDELVGMRGVLEALATEGADVQPEDCPPEAICRIIPITRS
jgi:MerR family Zn(II)-responsive transcriptional regulator of zntA